MKLHFRIIFAALLVFAVGCDKDEDAGPSLSEDAIEGAWELDEILDEDNDEVDFDDYITDMEEMHVLFESNGDFVHSVNTGTPVHTEGEWELDGDELKLEMETGDDADLKVVSFSENELRVQDEDEYILIFKRIDEDDFPEAPIDPNDAEAVSGALVVPGTKSNGNIPGFSSDPTAPYIVYYQTSATVTANNTLYIPFTFEAPNGYGGAYMQVIGASDYWEIEYDGSNTVDGQVVIPVEIPMNFLTGSFCVELAVFDLDGEVSDTYTMCIYIEEPIECAGSYSMSGSDGITITTFNFGEDAGSVSIDYDMYDLPDRLDVFYDGQWVAGTGPSVAAGEAPPASECYDGTVGFVSYTGTLEFEYDPDSDGPNSITVYMSGCYGGTGWDYTVYCPQ